MNRSDAPGPNLTANSLLAALSADEVAGLGSFFESVKYPVRTILFKPNEPISHVYFPIAGMISLLAVPFGKQGIEAGVVGREGFAGLPVFFGTDRFTGLGIVQMPLEALRMTAENFRDLARRDNSLHTLLMRYAHYLFCQVSQSLACGLTHPVEQRLCRWLLKVHDRAGADQFPLTQEFIANMLGVRRASVTVVAGSLQERGLIRYRRGRIHVLDRAGLERATCDCFRIVQNEWTRLFE